MKCFVEVSETTAKNNSEMKLLSNLQDVGEWFAALIYDLPESIGFDDFHPRCKSVLDALRRRSYLTNNMVKYWLIRECIQRKNFHEICAFSKLLVFL